MISSYNRRDWLKTGLYGLGAVSLLTNSSPFDLKRRHKDVVRLSHNENPYGPSANAREAIIQSISKGNRYPRQAITDLKEVIASKEGVQAKNILITAGSTEILGLMGLIYGIQKGNIISGFPTFDYLMSYSKNFDSEWIRIPLDKEMYPLKKIEERIDSNTKLVFICNPNNPTGTYIPKSDMKVSILSMAQKTPVFVDEAYIEFTEGGINNSFAHIAARNPNVVVGRTFSKIYGMAGLRIGYAIAHEDSIKVMQKYFMGRMVTPSVTSLEAAKVSVGDDLFAEKSKSLTLEAKQMVYTAFEQWAVKHWRSHTNFIWFKTNKFLPGIYGSLEKKNVFIRTYSHTPGYARVSIGTKEEIQIFLDELGGLIA